MLESASAIRVFSLERWVRLPAARARCVGRFLAIAATLAGAKVLLSTIAVALFVAEQGAAGLPPFYLGFAAIAILLSFGLSSIIDRAPKVRLAQITFAGLLVSTAALRFLLALEVPGVSFALLASATAFEIIFDIVFWVVVAAIWTRSSSAARPRSFTWRSRLGARPAASWGGSAPASCPRRISCSCWCPLPSWS